MGSFNRNPTSSHYKWNQHDSTTLLLPVPLYGNIAEEWLHGFRSMLSCQNPPIWKFLECLTPVYKHHNNTIRLTIQFKAALTTCKHTVKEEQSNWCERKLNQDWRNGGGTTKDSRASTTTQQPQIISVVLATFFKFIY